MNDAPAVLNYRLYETVRRKQVRTYVPADDYRVLGTMASVVPTAREPASPLLEVDAYVVVAALGELAKRGEIDKKVVADDYQISTLEQIKLTRVWRKR